MKQGALAADRLVTCDPHADAGTGELGVIENAAIVLDGKRIAYVGPRARLTAHLPEGAQVIGWATVS
ncbi:MAG: hypothetical protein M3O36_16375 [Myxococcota bacterium]|nr:hypothetical protein [Myxococcota bacterium]